MIYTTLLKAVLHWIFGAPKPTPAGRPRAGLVMVFDGVGGLDLLGTNLLYAAPAAGLPHEIRIVPWGHGFGRWFRDLTDVENHKARAAAIATDLQGYRAENPDAPVYLVAKSGGAGIMVRVLESLPPDTVEVGVLVAPALSPRYDLTRALRAVRQELVAFWSPLDVIVLGLGTLVCGTIDRVHAPAAGLVSFRPPHTLDEEGRAQYEKLRQVRWRPRMAPTLYLGGHVGPDSPFFLRKYVVPLLKRDPAAAAHVETEAGVTPRR
jgi:hypothetical protein